jgi:hypothetical protein
VATLKTTDTLIVVSSINPVLDAPAVMITDPATRLFQLCCSLIAWSLTPVLRSVILSDNTLPEYDFIPLQRLMEHTGKKLEVLTFLGDRQQVALRGKGYGEGEIMRYIYENSELIKKCQSFYKITGRIYVNNFDRVHLAHETCTRVFDNPVPAHRRFAKRIVVSLFANSRHRRGMVRTVFYKCDTAFFLNNLIDRYKLVEDRQRFYLEHAYYYPLIKSGFSTFKIKPSLVGYSSSSGKLYQGTDFSEEIKERARSLMRSMC